MRSSPFAALIVVLVSSLHLHAVDDTPVLLADGTFQDAAQEWKQQTWNPKPATIVTEKETGQRFASLSVPKGYGNDIFTDAKIPAGCTAIRVKFRTRCHQTADPSLPSIMVMFGTGQKQDGKPIKLNPNGEWESHDVVVRFRPNPENDRFQITTVASPLSVEIDDISFSLPTDEEAKPLELKEGAGS